MKRTPQCRQTVTVELENGLHLVPCSQIARTSSEFACDIVIYNGDKKVDAKDIFDLMTLSAVHGTKLDIEAMGEGADEAVAALVARFEANFADEDT